MATLLAPGTSTFSTEQRQHAGALIEELPPPQRRSVRGALLVGSIAAGLGHEQSDIDVILVTDRPEWLHEQNYVRGGRRIDLLPMGVAALAELVELGTEFVATRRDRSQVMVDHVRAMKLARLACGELLLADDGIRAVLDRISPRAVARMLMVRAAIEAATFTEDVIGCVQSGDWHTALDASSLALRKACDTVLTATGDLYISDKFLTRRMARCPQLRSHYAPLWRAIHGGVDPATGLDPDAGTDRYAAVVRERLLLTNELAAWAQLDGWDGGLPDRPWVPARSRGPLRSPQYSLMRFADGLALAGPNTGFDVSEGTARLWLSLNGAPREQAIELFCIQAGLGPEHAPQVDAALAAMAAEGAIRPAGSDLLSAPRGDN